MPFLLSTWHTAHLDWENGGAALVDHFLIQQSQQALVTHREYYLGPLGLTRQALLAGRLQFLAFLAPRPIGWALLAKEFIRCTLASSARTCLPAYLDCQRDPLSPKCFAFYCTGAVLTRVPGGGGEGPAPFHDWAVQLTQAAPKRPSVGQPVE